MKPEIQTAFKTHKTNILAQLATIQKYIKANANYDINSIHWGHVGDMAHVEDQLKDIVDRINGTGEYAE